MVELRKQTFIAGCKQMVAGKAHNLEVVGSSPTPAIKFYCGRVKRIIIQGS